MHATTAIEGNTLSEAQVLDRVRGTLALPRSQEYLGREIDNVIEACNEIAGEFQSDPRIRLTTDRVLRFNRHVLKGLESATEVVPGSFRTYSVGVMSYRGAPWEDCPIHVDRFCEWLNGPGFESTDPEMKFALSVFKAILAHLYIAWIHPFGDGNGRTARLIEFQILLASGIPYPACHLLSNHYNKTRTRYYAELAKSSKVGEGWASFLEYAVEGFADGLREQVDYIRNCQWKVTWDHFVHEQFRGKDTPARSRRKHLVLDMPLGATSREGLPLVSPRVASAYGGRGEKTLARDLNALLEMKLVIRAGKGFAPNRKRILAFLPPTANEPAAISELRDPGQNRRARD